MSIKPIKAPAMSNVEFEMIPAGVYLTRCFRMVDIGTHTFDTKQFGSKDLHKVIITWELLQDDDGSEVYMSDGQTVFTFSKTYTLSMHKKSTLRHDLDAWRGVPFTDEEAGEFDITKLLNVFCKLQITHATNGDKTYANMGAIMTTRKKADALNAANSFSLEDRDMEVFESLPDWIKNHITSSFEWEEKSLDNLDISADDIIADGAEPIDLSDIPF